MKEKGFNAVSLNIPDMHCAGCARRIEAALTPINGISAGAINPASREARLEYADAQRLRCA